MRLLWVLLLVQVSLGLLRSRPAALLLEGLAFAAVFCWWFRPIVQVKRPAIRQPRWFSNDYRADDSR